MCDLFTYGFLIVTNEDLMQFLSFLFVFYFIYSVIYLLSIYMHTPFYKNKLNLEQSLIINLHGLQVTKWFWVAYGIIIAFLLLIVDYNHTFIFLSTWK